MRRRLRGADGEPEVIADLSARVADHLGDEAGARRWLERSAAAGPDEFSDCPGCAPARRARLLAGWGEWEAAALSAEAGLRDGPACPAQPERNLAALMLPYLKLGRAEEAAAAHLRSYRRHRAEAAAFGELGGHLRFCALGGEHERGLAILTAQLPRLAGATDELAAMEFAAAGAALCRTAAAPDGHLAALGAELLAARRLAGAFDARNGTGHQSGRVAAWLAEPKARPLPAQRAANRLSATTGRRRPRGSGRPAEARCRCPDDGTGDGTPAPLTVSAVTAVLRRRECRYVLDATGPSRYRSGPAVVQFENSPATTGRSCTRASSPTTASARRQSAAYAFCNWWNRDRLTPTAYVHDSGRGELVFGAG